MAEKEQDQNGPKIIHDEGWKQQAKADKDRLSDKKNDSPDAGDAAESGVPGQPTGPLPEASFMTLLNSLVVQAMYALGLIAASENEKPKVDLDLAKYHIETLAVLEEKTQGNLSEEESKALSMALQQMRMQYVAASQ